MVFWMGVQFSWRKIFPEIARYEDVLAARKDCGSCSHEYICQIKDNFKDRVNKHYRVS
jgi:hypothetical protein